MGSDAEPRTKNEERGTARDLYLNLYLNLDLNLGLCLSLYLYLNLSSFCKVDIAES